MRLTILAVVAVTTALVSGCGRAQTPSAPEGSAFERRAAQVAPLWHGKTGGFTPVQDLTIAPKDGFPDDQTKVAFGAGWFSTAVPLEGEAGRGTIQYSDGSKMDVDVVSADAAFKAMDQGDAGCPGCVTLEVTGVKLGQAPLRTSRGEATVPVWLFTIAQVPAPVARVAVAPEAITPLPTPSVPAWIGDKPLVSAQDVLAVNGSEIEFRLGVGACDAGVAGLVWEDAEVVVVGGSIKPPPPNQSCTAQLVFHPVKVTTAAPVGTRIIIDALTGAPVLMNSR